jgi:hypothetical protein
VKPPADLPSTLVALGEAYARRAGIDPGDFWAYVYRRAPPPPELRAAIVDAFFPRVRPDDFLGLTTRAENDTLAAMDATTIAAARRGRPMGHRKHPFVVALLRERLTVAEIAKDMNRSQSTVKSWYKAADDPAYRPIPRTMAAALEKRLGVPLSAWSRISE